MPWSPLPRRRPPPLPTARDLGLPRSARSLYDRLHAEPIGDWATLLAECRAHVADFEAALATNEFLPIAEARALAEALPRLVERARAHPKPALAERLAWIAARYFVIKDDGAHDFVIVGLDDDVAVYNAVVRHLGVDDLALDLS